MPKTRVPDASLSDSRREGFHPRINAITGLDLTLVTGADGNATFSDLPPCTYTVTEDVSSKSGFVAVSNTVVVREASEAGETVTASFRNASTAGICLDCVNPDVLTTPTATASTAPSATAPPPSPTAAPSQSAPSPTGTSATTTTVTPSATAPAPVSTGTPPGAIAGAQTTQTPAAPNAGSGLEVQPTRSGGIALLGITMFIAGAALLALRRR